MIRHIVILHFKKDIQINYTKILISTKPLILEIPGIIRYEIFQNMSKYTPNHVFSLGVEIIFKDEEALNTFMEHPNHCQANAMFESYLSDPPYMVLTHKISDFM
jgi:hypothetical protein